MIHPVTAFGIEKMELYIVHVYSMQHGFGSLNFECNSCKLVVIHKSMVEM